MRRGWIAAVAAAVIVTGMPRAARADDRADIQALYARLSKALTSGRLDDTLALETPDFKSVGIDGRVQNGRQLVAEMKQHSAGMKLLAMNIRIASMSIKGATADVTTRFDAKSETTDAAGQMGPKGAKHVLTMSGVMHNTLVKGRGGWKFRTLEEKTGKTAMDGKPFDPSKMGQPKK